ncbi:nitrogenase component 1 [Ureibacillus terrenus]|uniref:nitrogenase component 1 n=1 Tax=Ureibacillus terrenus TaxID=118246 RepID=UPI002E22F52E|nr:nitrogenase component 1 [Ureibacillus terrenus]
MSKISSVFLPANEYLGVLWALSGVKDVAVINHGTGGCNFFEFATASDRTKRLIHDRFCSTGMEAEDIALSGGEDKLKAAIEEMAQKGDFSMIAIIANPVSSLIGVDIEAVAKEAGEKTGIPIITFGDSVWQEQAEKGIELALVKLVEHLCADQKDKGLTKEPSFSVNIIGPTIQTYNWKSDKKELCRLLSFLGMEVKTVIPYDTTTEEIKKLPQANLNIVATTAGLQAAKYLERHFQIPYIYGLPYGKKGTFEWLQEIAKMTNNPLPMKWIKEEMAFPVHHYFERIADGTFYQKEWTVALACPPVMAKKMIQMVTEDWELRVAAVRLTTVPEKEEAEELESLSVPMYVTPSELEWKKILRECQPFILMGSAEDRLLAKEIPVHLRIVEPAFDVFSFFEGTPLVGWEGFKCMTQQLLNEISRYAIVSKK